MRTLLVAGAMVLAVAGCAPTVAEPAPPVGSELEGYIDEQLSWIAYDKGADYDFNGNDCLAQAQLFLEGFDVTVMSDDEIVRVSELFESEMSQCEDGVLVAPNDAGYYSAAQLDYLYDYFQDSLVPCLQLQGLEVGFAPSRSDFAATAGWVSWDPYTELGADLPPSRAAEIRQRCPGLPAAGFVQ